ncbi:MAG TPA: hypothetical protein VGS41_04295 [Chthonomonadales bacterium]|nr:hypothetical protein [Chthonomonadales bacterium]
MTAIQSGKSLRCDGAGCGLLAAAPVALRRRIPCCANELEEAKGWLFILKDRETLHYCPACAKAILERAAGVRAE